MRLPAAACHPSHGAQPTRDQAVAARSILSITAFMASMAPSGQIQRIVQLRSFSLETYMRSDESYAS
ncbi:hypothetical protein BS78_09G078500 [Paspalum vaginatum]|nr:hypothetical protein BS78_09G078500 [Paspalum vaginatum]